MNCIRQEPASAQCPKNDTIGRYPTATARRFPGRDARAPHLAPVGRQPGHHQARPARRAADPAGVDAHGRRRPHDLSLGLDHPTPDRPPGRARRVAAAALPPRALPPPGGPAPTGHGARAPAPSQTPGARLPWRKLVGVVIASAGIVVLFARRATLGAPTLPGDVIMFISALLLGERTVYPARVVQRLDPVQLL